MPRSLCSSIVVAAMSALALMGCSGPGIKTHPVTGKVEIKDGDAALLAGSGVELLHETDEALRPSGNIDAAGNFLVKTMYKGDVLEGAPEGKYKARIVLGDPSDDGVPKRPPNFIHPRYLNFDKSGLTVTVPGSDYNVSLSKK